MYIHTSLEALLFSPKHEKLRLDFFSSNFKILLCTQENNCQQIWLRLAQLREHWDDFIDREIIT